MRDDTWLKAKLDEIWGKYFSDITRSNIVHIGFGRKAKCRLASIKQKKRNNKLSDTQINVTGYFQDPAIPESIVSCTIAHELCHYAHGFGSPLPQFSRYPHRGDLVDSELRKRGFTEQLKFQKSWLKENWSKFVGETFHHRIRHRRRRTSRPSSFGSFIRMLGF